MMNASEVIRIGRSLRRHASFTALKADLAGSSLQFLYQQSQKLFADSAIEAECPVPERYLTADAEL